MHPLRPVTKATLARVEAVTGKPIQFMRDDKLALLATLQMARNGADFHILRYQPSNEPLDYLITFQAGFVLRLFDNEPDRRFDFAPDDAAGDHVAALMSAGGQQSLGPADRQALPGYARHVAQWALLNLRSLPIGMRIDRWIADTCPELAELQRASITQQQQQNTQVLAHRLGKLSVPITLLGNIAAYAVFADRLLGTRTCAVPYEAMGLLGQAHELLQILDDTPADARHDVALVDRWAAQCGLAGWYRWIAYRP
jgi:hypothetical protein